MTRRTVRLRRAWLVSAGAAVAALAACTLNPQPLPPADIAGNGTPDAGSFGSAAADGAVAQATADDAGGQNSRDGALPTTPDREDAGDAGADDAGDAGDADAS